MLFWREKIVGLGDGLEQCVACPSLEALESRLELGIGHLDRLHVETVGR